MKTTPLILIIILFASLGVYAQQPAPVATAVNAEPVKKAFTKDDIDKLIKDNKILMLDFSAVWCQPCKEMAPVIDEIEKENKDKIKVVHVDYDINRQLANAMYVYEIPFLQIYVDGKISQNVVGMMAKDKIMELIPTK